MKSEKIRKTLLLPFSLLLFAFAASAAELPAGYTELESISSTGTQYIDTGYTHKANTKIVCEVSVASEQPSSWAGIFGARKNSFQSNAFCFFAKCDDDVNKACYNRSGNETRSGSAFPKGVKTTLTCDGANATWATVDGTSGNIVTTGTCDDGVNTMFVFNLNTADTDGKRADPSPCAMTLYSFRIYEGESLVREFVPCLNDALEAGLYEMQTRKFHANAGTGDFPCNPDPWAVVRVPVHVEGAWTSGDGAVTNVIEGGSFRVLKGTENVKVIGMSKDPTYVFASGAKTSVVELDVVNGDIGPLEFPLLVHRQAEYVDENGELRTNDTFMIVTAATTQLTNGWYLVEGTVERGEIDVAAGCTANLILVDGASLTVQGAFMGAGIDVRQGETLNIYAQRCGTGRLTAVGGYNGAGIGGGNRGDGGTVTINGGTVKVTGGEYGAGIGGGFDGDGGTVTINGGTVTATGGDGGAGIGGCYGSGGTVTINGGTVTATGCNGGAGIGGGFDGDGDTVTINGGTVTATGGDGGAGIGGGYNGAGGTVTFGADRNVGVFVGENEANRVYVPRTAYASDHSAANVWICKNMLSILSAAFCVGDVATVVVPVYDGDSIVGHRVTLGTDYTDGVTLPTDVGAVTIDLNGWTISGAEGVAGTATSPGGKGGAAITVAGTSGANAGETTISVEFALPSDITGSPIGAASAVGDVMVVDLERNVEGRFPVRFYRGVDMGVFNCDAYKTSKIALRRIPKGVAYPVEARATSYPITKTLVPQRDFYVGLFEITGAQYDRVMGAESPSASMTPMRYASYSDFRSPTGSTQLDPPSSDKFIGILLADAVDASGNPVGGFDLPTANQWEIAARAGATGEFGAYLDENGLLVEGTAENVAAFAQTGSGHVVGSLRPNAWGIYDMCGGVGEWCRTSGRDVETAVKDSYWPLRGNDVTDWNVDYILSKYVGWTGYSGVNCGARLSCTLDVSELMWNEVGGVCGGRGGDGNPPGVGGVPVADANGNEVAVDAQLGLCRNGVFGDSLVHIPNRIDRSYVVSNLTLRVEVEKMGDEGDASGALYALPLGARVAVYTVAKHGYEVVRSEPYVIESVTPEVVIDADVLEQTAEIVPILYMVTCKLEGDMTESVSVDVTVDGESVMRRDEGWPVANGRTATVTFTATGGRVFAIYPASETYSVDVEISGRDPDAVTCPRLLPVGYTLLQSITSTGSQYIDTGYAHKANTKIVCEVSVASEQPSSWAGIFGARKNSFQSNAFCFFAKCDDDVNKACYNRSGNEMRSATAFPKWVRTTLTCEGAKATWTAVDGTSGSIATTGTCDNGANAMFVFNLNTADSDGKKADTSPCVMTLYSFRIYEGETLVRDFVPCFNDALGAGLYEVQTGEFHANAGTGEFTCSPDSRITVKIPAHLTGVWTSGDGSVTNVIDGGSFRVLKGTENVKVIITPDPAYVFASGAMTSVVEFAVLNEDVGPQEFPEVVHRQAEYVDENGELRTNDTFAVVTAATAQLTDGWYLVEGTVDRGGIDVAAGCTAYLILADGASLAVQGGNRCAGVDVCSGETLVIYGQREGTGRLSAKGGQEGAGIGGWAAGTIRIHGGVIAATGGFFCAGIGCGFNQAGERVVITGGRVNAIAGLWASRIGRGYGDGSTCPVSISGGVFAHELEDGWLAVGYGAFANPDPRTRADYPCAVLPGATVTVGEHVTVAWTSGDGAETNAVDGATFKVLKGTEALKVIVAPDPAYVFASGAKTSVVEFDAVNEDVDIRERFELVHRQAEYVGENGELRTNDTFSVVTAATAQLTDGWYLVEGTVERGGIDVAAGCTAHLILADGASLAVRGDEYCAGIDVCSGETLVIYGQREGTGRLSAKGGSSSAGIGGSYPHEAGTIWMHGCTIVATGGYDGAGIGGCYHYPGGKVAITGGRVNAIAGDRASRIGRGYSSEVCQVSISGGVFAHELEDGWLAEGYESFANPDPRTRTDYPCAVLPAATVTVGELEHLIAAWTSGDGAETNAVDGVSFKVPKGAENVKVIITPDPAYVFASGAKASVVEFDVVNEDVGLLEFPEVVHRLAEYVDENGELRTNDTFAVVTAATAQLTDGWYLVEGTVDRGGIDVAAGCTAHLILADGASLAVQGGNRCAGVDVCSGETLVIYGQREGTGRLSAKGGDEGAGIGASGSHAVGIIKIHGGTIASTGGSDGAGIGCCYSYSGEKIVITGGRVNAIAGYLASRIGRGFTGSSCPVSISGGVFAHELEDGWLADGCGSFENPDPRTRADYPCAVLPAATVAVGELRHMTAAWTSGDGAETNAVDGVSFKVPKGAKDVKVIFTSDPGCSFDDGAVSSEVFVGSVEGDCSVTVPMSRKSEVETFGRGWCVTVPRGAYIDTLFRPDSNTRVEMDVLVQDAGEYWFGCWDWNYNDGAFALGNDRWGIYVGYGNQGGTFGEVVGNGRHTVELDRNVVKVDGREVHAYNVESFASLANNLYLFAQNRRGTPAVEQSQDTIVCYGCRIWANGADGAAVPVRNFVPARTKDERQVVGLYDTVAGEFHANQGAGEFSCDPDPCALVSIPAYAEGVWTSGDGTVTNAIEGGSFWVMKGTENVNVILFVKDPAYVFASGTSTRVVELDVVNEDVGPQEFPGVVHRQAEYVDENGELGTNDTFSVVTAATAQLTDGWYLVEGTVERGGIDVAAGCTAHLILADGASLVVQGVDYGAGIGVGAGETLVIYGQRDGTGKLSATGGDGGAGIGGGSREVHGRIEICGGMIYATGGRFGAAIGSGGYAYGCIGDEDRLVVSGGLVTASAGSGGAAIGGGYDSVFGPVTVSGGTVDAGGSESRSNDIGNGWNREGCAVTITGGSVLARAAKVNLPPTDGARSVHCVAVNLGLGGARSGTVELEGLGGYGVNDVVAIDGGIYLYLPDGDYQFKADGEDYCARVAGGATSARRGFLPTGVTVNGSDLSTQSGTGWTWNRMASELACDAGAYVLSGTNTGLTVNATLAEGATVVASNLVLAAFNGPLTVGGTTVDLVSLDGILTVTGGSVRVGGETVASNLSERVWCVTVDSEELRVKSEELVEIAGLEDYGTDEIAAIDGKVYLWLPNGRHAFEANGVRYYANVADGPTTAAAFVGFAVNGEDVVAGRGTGWELPDGLLTLDGTSTNAFELVGELSSDLGVGVTCGEGRDAVAIRVSGSVLAVTNDLAFALVPKTAVRTVDTYAFAVKADGSLALGKGRYHFNPEGLYDAETLAAVLVADGTWQIIDRPEDTGIRANGLDIGGVEWTADGSACHFNTNDWTLSFNHGLPFSLEGTNLTERPIALSLAPDGLSVTFTNLVVTTGAGADFTIAAGCDPAYWGFFTNAANTVLAGEGVYAFDPTGRTMDGLTSGRIGADRWRVVPVGSFKARATVDDVTYSCLTLAEALAFAGKGGRIELDADVEGETLLAPSGSSFALDGNGHMIAPEPAATADALVTVASNCLIAVTDVVFDGRGAVSNALAAVESFGALALEDCTVRGFRVPEGTLIAVDSSLGSAAPALSLSNLATADNVALGAVSATAGTSLLAVNAPKGELEDVLVLAEGAEIAFTNAAPAARLVLNPLDAANRVGETLVRSITGGVALDPAKVRICAAGYSAVGDGQGGIVLESVTSRPFAVREDAAFTTYRTFGEALAAADDGRVAAVYYENVPEGVAMVTNAQDITVGAGTNAAIGTVYRMTPDGTNTVWTFPTDKTAVLAGRIRVKGSLVLENVEVVSPLVLDGGVIAVGADYDLGGVPAEITFADASALAEGSLVVTSSVRSAAQLLDAFCVRMPGYVLTAEAGGLAVRALANSFAAKIGDACFHSLAAAVAAAKDGETVEAITLTNLTRRTVRDTVTAEGTCAVGSGRRIVLGSAVCALDELGRVTALVASNVQSTVVWPAGSRLEIGADAALAPSNVVFTGTLTLAGAGVLDLAAYGAGEISVAPQRLGKVAANASGKLRLADGTDGELAILANGDAIYRRGSFTAWFEESGNGVGKICIDDYGTYSEIACDGPITSGSVSRHYANPETGVDTEVVVGVLYVDGTHTVVLPTEVTRAAADPRYTAADGSRKPLTGGYLPSDIKVADQAVELWLYDRSFTVSGIDVLTKDNREEKGGEVANAVISEADKGSDGEMLRRVFGNLWKDIVEAGIMAAIYEIDQKLNKAIATVRKIISTLEGCVSLLKRMSATLYLDEGDNDGDYYLASNADDAFDKALNGKHTVRFMRSARIAPYTADGDLVVDMRGAPNLDVSKFACWVKLDLGDETPQFVQNLVNKMVSKMVAEAAKAGTKLVQEASKTPHVSAQYEDSAAPWLRVTGGAQVTVRNFDTGAASIGRDLPCELMAVDSGALTLELATICDFRPSAGRSAIRVANGAKLLLKDSCNVTGNESSGVPANVFVAAGARLSVDSSSSRVGISGQTEDGEAFAQTGGKSFDWPSIYSNDAHTGDSTYEIEVNDKNELCWKWNVPDPDAPSFPEPGDESTAGGRALNIRMITKEVEPGVVMSYARIWGAPTNAVKGAWYYLKATEDLGSEFLYLPGFKWRAAANGAMEAMQQGPDGSCCDIPAPNTITNRFFRFAAQKEEP